MRAEKYVADTLEHLCDEAEELGLHMIETLLRQTHGALCLYLWEVKEKQNGPDQVLKSGFVLDMMAGCQAALTNAMATTLEYQRAGFDEDLLVEEM